MKNYTYPDPYDVITNHFIEQNELYPGYWQKSENRIIQRLLSQIKTHLPQTGKTFLDAGCGEGRMLPEFAPLFDKITAIDPDHSRLLAAHRLATEKGIADKTTLYNYKLEELDPNIQVDFVLSSHILQHIPTVVLPEMIRKLAKHLKGNGLLAIMTCHAVAYQESFTRSYLKNEKVIEEKISETAFNTALDQKGILPAHFFESQNLIKTFEKEGLNCIDHQIFHLSIEETTRKENADDYYNSSPELQAQHGRDMFLLFHKQ